MKLAFSQNRQAEEGERKRRRRGETGVREIGRTGGEEVRANEEI